MLFQIVWIQNCHIYNISANNHTIISLTLYFTGDTNKTGRPKKLTDTIKERKIYIFGLSETKRMEQGRRN